MPSLSLKYRDAFPACEGRAYLNCARGRARLGARADRDQHLARRPYRAGQHGLEGVVGSRRRGAGANRGAHRRLARGGRIRQEHVARSGDGGGRPGDWRPGDEVAVASTIEYPSNVYAWKHLADRGVTLREIRGGGRGGDSRIRRGSHGPADPAGHRELGAVHKRPPHRCGRHRTALPGPRRALRGRCDPAGRGVPHRREGERHPRHGRLLPQVDAGPARDRIPVRRPRPAAESAPGPGRLVQRRGPVRLRRHAVRSAHRCIAAGGGRADILPWSTASGRRSRCCSRRASPTPPPTSRRCSTARRVPWRQSDAKCRRRPSIGPASS